MFEIFVTIAGVLMSLSYYPQAYKIWRNKSAKDISISTYATLSAGILVWLSYGLYKNDSVIMISFSVGFFGALAVLILSIIYRNS